MNFNSTVETNNNHNFNADDNKVISLLMSKILSNQGKEGSNYDFYIKSMLLNYLDLQNNKQQNKNTLELQLNLLVRMSQLTNLKLNSMNINTINHNITNNVNNANNDSLSCNLKQESSDEKNETTFNSSLIKVEHDSNQQPIINMTNFLNTMKKANMNNPNNTPNFQNNLNNSLNINQNTSGKPVEIVRKINSDTKIN